MNLKTLAISAAVASVALSGAAFAQPASPERGPPPAVAYRHDAKPSFAKDREEHARKPFGEHRRGRHFRRHHDHRRPLEIKGPRDAR